MYIRRICGGMDHPDLDGLVREVKPFSHSAHITVPRTWLGRKVLVLDTSETVLVVGNDHTAGKPPAHLKESSRFAAYFETPNGNQMVFVRGSRDEPPIVHHGGYGWAELRLHGHADGLVALNNGRPVELSTLEWNWIVLCLTAYGISDPTQLPSTPVKMSAERRRLLTLEVAE